MWNDPMESWTRGGPDVKAVRCPDAQECYLLGLRFGFVCVKYRGGEWCCRPLEYHRMDMIS